MDKHLLLLDLDETLVFASETALERPCDHRIGEYHVYRRPHLDPFLDSVFQWFDVAVWSSANALYVNSLVDAVFPDPERFRFVWSEQRCTQRFDPEHLDYYWIKNLKKVQKLGHSLERIVMIDDTHKKLERNYGNHLWLRPFLGDAADRELAEVLPFLNWLRGVENVRKVEKRTWRSFRETSGGP